MVESSIGIPAAPLIAEESVFDPILGVATAVVYGGIKIFDKIKHKNKDDYTIDAMTDGNKDEKTSRDDAL
jgi:hypothetical protein